MGMFLAAVARARPMGETLRCAGSSPTRQPEKECSLVSDSNADNSPNVDIETLLTLAREKSQEGQNSLFDTVQELFVQNDGNLTDRERALMSEILRQLIHEVELSVCQDVAERLSERDDAPRERVLALANDYIEVAHLLLLNNSVLHDVDLIEIIKHRTQAHQLAVSMRKDVSEDVSDALVETGDTGVITRLLENEDAAITSASMEYIVAESKRVDPFQNPLINRKDLPPDMARKMYWWVSVAVRQQIVDNFSIDPATIDDSIVGVVKDRIEATEDQAKKTSAAERVTEEMAAHNKLTEEFLLNALRDGEIPLFQSGLAQTLGIHVKLMRRLIYEPGGEGLAMGCKAVGFSTETFAKIFHLTREATGANGPFDTREFERLADFYDCLKPDHAEKVVSRWRRDPDFLHAVKRMEEAS